jgi:hypothetical protein
MTVQTNGNLPFKLAMVLYPLSELGLLRADKTLESELAMDAGWRSNPKPDQVLLASRPSRAGSLPH